MHHFSTVFVIIVLYFHSPKVRKALYLAEQRDREEERAHKRPRRASAAKGKGKGKGKGRSSSTKRSTDDSDGGSEIDEAVGLDLEA